MNKGVRERAREATRTELAGDLIAVFADRGFDSTTVEEAAQAVGISRATYFRYFKSKEDAVLAAVAASGTDVAGLDLVRVIDAPWTVLVRHIIDQIADRADDDSSRDRVRMVMTTSSIRMHLSELRSAQRGGLVDALQEAGATAARARVLATLTFSILDLVWDAWVASSARRFADVVDSVFVTVAEVTGVDAIVTTRA